MIINNDIIIFESADFDLMSPELRKGLTQYIGDRIPIEDRFSSLLNDFILEAKKTLGLTIKESFTNLAEAYALADKSKQDQAKAFIEQAKAVLSVTDQLALPTPIKP